MSTEPFSVPMSWDSISTIDYFYFFQFDENKDGFLFPEEVLEALESVNSNLLSDSHINYIYRVSSTLRVISYWPIAFGKRGYIAG